MPLKCSDCKYALTEKDIAFRKIKSFLLKMTPITFIIDRVNDDGEICPNCGAIGKWKEYKPRTRK